MVALGVTGLITGERLLAAAMAFPARQGPEQFASNGYDFEAGRCEPVRRGCAGRGNLRRRPQSVIEDRT